MNEKAVTVTDKHYLMAEWQNRLPASRDNVLHSAVHVGTLLSQAGYQTTSHVEL